MPNWCNNVLTVVGSVDELKEFARYVESDEMVLDFEEIIPEPPLKNIPMPHPDGKATKKPRS